MVSELLACPFCGGEAVIDDFSTSYRTDAAPLWFVGCLNEGCPMTEATGQSSLDKADAVRRWNTRAALTPSSGEM